MYIITQQKREKKKEKKRLKKKAGKGPMPIDMKYKITELFMQQSSGTG